MLSKDFLKLIIVAALVAFPIAWWGLHKWLQDFVFRIGIAWWIFILAGVVTALVAFVTISLQAIKAANANPVKSLRAE
jgi:putative ABC transport system permease protein